MAEEKIYRAATGVDEFYYGEVGDKLVADYIERVKFLQNVNVEMAQEIVRAYGDNKTAEMAVSSGDVSVTSQFHTIPIEDKQKLLGLEVVEGLTAMGSGDNPPYVAVVFAKTYEDGSKEYVGLPKGIFTRPNIEGQTKEDSVEFSSEEIEAQFMDRKVDGFEKEKSVIFARDKKGETTNRDALFLKVFGKPYPSGTPSEPEGA
ncbi:major tail protein [Bacillus niameyensis]|uniref:major tail protein n=1 Tax=Bacillus niameyensis TaxID=1522308 RepID=UPI0007810A40|nr:major tail protein [Bacillus niameyensis]